MVISRRLMSQRQRAETVTACKHLSSSLDGVKFWDLEDKKGGYEFPFIFMLVFHQFIYLYFLVLSYGRDLVSGVGLLVSISAEWTSTILSVIFSKFTVLNFVF
jgi:hypothetical protein